MRFVSVADHVDLDATLLHVAPFVVKVAVTGAVDYYLSLELTVVTGIVVRPLGVCLTGN